MADSNVYQGIGVPGLLGCIFVTLKLTGTITWSWWWVTCPFWGPSALVIGILAIIGLFVLFGMCVCACFGKKLFS